MNTMFSDRPNSPRNQKTLSLVNSLLKECSLVIAREEISLQYAKDNLKDANAKLIPDALFTWFGLVNDSHKVNNGKYYLAHAAECDEAYYNFEFSKPYLLISGSSAGIIESNQEKTVTAYGNLVTKIKSIYSGNVYLIQVCEGDEFLNKVAKKTNTPIISMETPIIAAAKILANAEVFVSGRYHPAIMASLGGTPCVFMGSNSHKTWSLQILLNYPSVKEYKPIPSEEDIESIANDVTFLIKNKSVREKIKSRALELSNEAQVMADLIQ